MSAKAGAEGGRGTLQVLAARPHAFYADPYTLALRSGTDRLTPRSGSQAALSVLECRGAQSKRKTTRHSSSGTNQVEPRCRKALMRETTGLCQPLPIDLST